MIVSKVCAYDFIYDGIYYRVIKSYNGLTCEVTSGDNKYVGDIIIPEEVTYNNSTLFVTSIGERAFSECSALTSVMIPNTVQEICKGAFYNCSSLRRVTIPNSVTNIGDIAFEYCHSLNDVTIPNLVTNIGVFAFDDCN